MMSAKPVNYWEFAEKPATSVGAGAPPSADLEMSDAALMEMFSKKKKKKKSSPTDQPLTKEESEDVDDTYEELLRRLYQQMGSGQDTSSMGLKLRPPKVEAVGSKKSAWVNFRKTSEALNRPEDHLSLFLTAELGCLASVTDEGALLLRGKFAASQVESCLRKYIDHYVKCGMCRSSQTHLQKDTGTRIMMVKCDHCHAVRAVETIRTGFHATTKADRKKAAQTE